MPTFGKRPTQNFQGQPEFIFPRFGVSGKKICQPGHPALIASFSVKTTRQAPQSEKPSLASVMAFQKVFALLLALVYTANGWFIYIAFFGPQS